MIMHIGKIMMVTLKKHSIVTITLTTNYILKENIKLELKINANFCRKCCQQYVLLGNILTFSHAISLSTKIKHLPANVALM